MAEHDGWAVKWPPHYRRRPFMFWTLKRTRKAAIAEAVALWKDGIAWKVLYRRGYRVKKVVLADFVSS